MKTLIVENIPLLREALLLQLEPICQLSVLPAAALEQFESFPSGETPELLWLDGTLRTVKETGLIQFIRRKFPETRILVFGVDETVPEIKKLFKQGIHAYLPKSSSAEDIQKALEEIIAGNLYIPAFLTKTFSSWLLEASRKKKRDHELTERETQILFLIVEEHTTNEIAQKLFISHCTVETHRINMIHKLGVKNTAGLVRVAFEAGLYSRGFF